MTLPYDPKVARTILESYPDGTPEDKARHIAEMYGKRKEMEAALEQHAKLSSRRNAFRGSGKDLAELLELLDEVCNPCQLLSQNTGYAKVIFEPKAEYGGDNKKLYTFDQSLKRLQSAGLDRHPRPQESLGLLIADLENKLTPEQKAVADDMLNSYGEWLSLAMLRNGNELSLYYDPENLVWSGNRYEAEGALRYAEESKFNVRGLPSEKVTAIKIVNTKSPQLVEALWSRPFKDLPHQIREHAGLYLPPEGQILPVGRGSFGYGFNVVSYYFDDRASRGVVVGAPKK